MLLQQTLAARAVACALATLAVGIHAEERTTTLAPVVVTAEPTTPETGGPLMAPAKVLSGDALRDKLGSSLGETLSGELGVSASGFSAATSRPVIRGLDGPRVKILQNGMGSGDLSAMSEDHAIGSSLPSATQIDILRGPASLLYGSGAAGGLVNIINDRIPTQLESAPTGESELRYGSVADSTLGSFSAQRSAGDVGLHVDGAYSDAGNYRIPGYANLSTRDELHRLSFSGSRENSLGFGASLVKDWGHIGASLSQLNRDYGIHGADENSTIAMTQTRVDLDALLKSPLDGFEALRIRVGQNNYSHTEYENGTDPSVRFSHQLLETRWELSHLPWAGWRGKFGLQSEQGHVQATNSDTLIDPTVPRTQSNGFALFAVEQRQFGAVTVEAGSRYEHIARTPANNIRRSFDLGSASIGTQWQFTPAHAVGLTASLSQRAPTAEELYSDGPHHPTSSYDIGDATLKRENAHNLELSLQKNAGQLRWKANLYENRIDNFIYGSISQPGTSGMAFDRRFTQGDATLRGIEAEVIFNPDEPGWQGRLFADGSRGTLDGQGNLPLQPPVRIGASAGYQQAGWRSSVSVIHASAHDRIASTSISNETVTAGYTLLNADISYRQQYRGADLTWFLLARNLLNEDIRLSTSLLKDYVPQPGRNLMLGVRARF